MESKLRISDREGIVSILVADGVVVETGDFGEKIPGRSKVHADSRYSDSGVDDLVSRAVESLNHHRPTSVIKWIGVAIYEPFNGDAAVAILIFESRVDRLALRKAVIGVGGDFDLADVRPLAAATAARDLTDMPTTELGADGVGKGRRVEKQTSMRDAAVEETAEIALWMLSAIPRVGD